AGNVDVLTSAATHGYLPLMERDSTLYGQIKTGVDTYVRHMGRKPQGIWLPECGYRPGYMKESKPSYYKPGEEEFLAAFGIKYFFTDTHVIEVDHARNYRAGIKQALQYAGATKKKAGLALIMDGTQDTFQAVEAAKKLCAESDVAFWLINEYVSVNDLAEHKPARAITAKFGWIFSKTLVINRLQSRLFVMLKYMIR
ncbi:MAG: hypothetical protein HGA79_04950, partial [Anaerolineales bacterium]|nr:hypothetical protein [Anaerolineales bacterium]